LPHVLPHDNVFSWQTDYWVFALKDQLRLSLDSPFGLRACHGKPKLNVHS